MPKPGKNENRKEFLERCMSFQEMNEKFPDTKQRFAVCVSMWKEHKKKETKK